MLAGVCRYEVVPLKSLRGQLEFIPTGTPVTVTCSPSRGVPATLEAAEELRRLGHEVVPHVAARQVTSRVHLVEIVARLRDLGVTDLFVPGGDVDEAIGPYDSARSLLRDLSELDHPFQQIGVAAYPEGHPIIPDDVLLDALRDKGRLATYMVTQLCFSAQRTGLWLRDMRARGIDLDLYVGVPGALDRKKLLSISLKIGIGESIRFLRKQTGLGKLVGLGTYRPDALVAELGDVLSEDSGVRGLHIYTFNQLAQTDAWRREVLSSQSLQPAKEEVP